MMPYCVVKGDGTVANWPGAPSMYGGTSTMQGDFLKARVFDGRGYEQGYSAKITALKACKVVVYTDVSLSIRYLIKNVEPTTILTLSAGQEFNMYNVSAPNIGYSFYAVIEDLP